MPGKLTRPVLAGMCALDDDPEPVSSLSPRDLKKIIFSLDKAMLLESVQPMTILS